MTDSIDELKITSIDSILDKKKMSIPSRLNSQVKKIIIFEDVKSMERFYAQVSFDYALIK